MPSRNLFIHPRTRQHFLIAVAKTCCKPMRIWNNTIGAYGLPTADCMVLMTRRFHLIEIQNFLLCFAQDDQDGLVLLITPIASDRQGSSQFSTSVHTICWFVYQSARYTRRRRCRLLPKLLLILTSSFVARGRKL